MTVPPPSTGSAVGGRMVSFGHDERTGSGTEQHALLSPGEAVSLTDQQQRQYALVEALRNPACYAHPTQAIQVIETHISIVVLTGAFVYKIKKPVNLGFLDFSTPLRRKYFCEEEVRLNSRYAPEIYLGVVTFSGSPGTPLIRDRGEGFEYAVRMVQFDQQSLLAEMLLHGELRIAHIQRVADKLAQFHLGSAARTDSTTSYGTPTRVLSPMLENFSQLEALSPSGRTMDELRSLQEWTRSTGLALTPRIENRRHEGFVRECHGDLHLDNIAIIKGRAVMFDGIEFNPYLRFIDTMSELAFPVMDLQRHGARDLANVLLNDYLEITGDYDGLDLFKLYGVYRALVRAKILAIRARQQSDAVVETAEFASCLAVARAFTQKSKPRLLITHGLSGSGKSYIAELLVRNHDLLRLRSDYVRKRLHGFAPRAWTDSGLDEGIYSQRSTDRTYSELADASEKCLRAGFSVVVDATFLSADRRAAFRDLAERTGAVFNILDIHAPDEDLTTRISARKQDADAVSEADLAVLAAQRQNREPLAPHEIELALRVDNPGTHEPVLEHLFD